MAILSSHFLNAADGSHAASVEVTLVHIAPEGTRRTVFVGTSDDGGRFSRDVEVAAEGSYEMVIASAAYFSQFALPQQGHQILSEICIRFTMPDPDGRYHIPVIMAPHSYSCWWSR